MCLKFQLTFFIFKLIILHRNQRYFFQQSVIWKLVSFRLKRCSFCLLSQIFLRTQFLDSPNVLKRANDFGSLRKKSSLFFITTGSTFSLKGSIENHQNAVIRSNWDWAILSSLSVLEVRTLRKVPIKLIHFDDKKLIVLRNFWLQFFTDELTGKPSNFCEPFSWKFVFFINASES